MFLLIAWVFLIRFVCLFICLFCVCVWLSSVVHFWEEICFSNKKRCEVVILRRALDVQTLAQLSSDLRQQGFIKLLGFSVCLLIFCCYGYTRPVAVLHLLLPLMPPATLTVLLNQALEFLTVLHYLQWELLLAPVLFEKPFEVYCICRSLVIDASVIRNVLFCF